MRRAALTLIVALFTACGDSAPTGGPASPTPTTPQTATPTPTPRPIEATAVVYAPWPVDEAKTPRDLFVWDVATGSLRRLTNDDRAVEEELPRFHGPDRITYAVEGSLREMPASGGPAVELARVTGRISAIDWNGAGTTAVVISVDWDNNQTETVWLYTTADKRLKKIRSFLNPCGREWDLDDDVSVWWSGTRILFVNTCLEPSVRILEADGSDSKTGLGTPIAPFWGTFARWTCDGSGVIFKEYGNDATGAWHVLNLRDGKRVPLDLPKRAYNLTVSPDGCRLGYGAGVEEPELWVYDWATRTSKKVATGYAAPLWISGTELVAADVARCDDVETCGETRWTIAGEGARIDVAAGTLERIKLRSTNYFTGYWRQSDALFLRAA